MEKRFQNFHQSKHANGKQTHEKDAKQNESLVTQSITQ